MEIDSEKGYEHLGKFPIGLYLKVKDSTKNVVTFVVLVRGILSNSKS